jgi:hypothetical protein
MAREAGDAVYPLNRGDSVATKVGSYAVGRTSSVIRHTSHDIRLTPYALGYACNPRIIALQPAVRPVAVNGGLANLTYTIDPAKHSRPQYQVIHHREHVSLANHHLLPLRMALQPCPSDPGHAA